MRAARECIWLLDETPTSRNGRILALNLGADYCAEHEWGIKKLKESFGIQDNDISVYGIDKRRISEVPENLYYLVEGNISILTMRSYWQKPEVLTVKALKSQELYDRNPLNTAWDEGSFGVLVKGKDDQKKLETLYEAIQRKDAAIWLGGGQVFQNAGLCIGIVSNLPKAALNAMKAKDEDYHKLQIASEATGIKKKIDDLNHGHKGVRGGIFDAPCGYFALSPAWIKGDKKDTRYNVMYWLNPMKQQENNFGWFTVEELELWMEGKGPIPGKKKAV